MTPEEVEEARFRSRIKRSMLGAEAVANHYRARGFEVVVPELRVRPKFEDRHQYNDGGYDLKVRFPKRNEWFKIEVKLRDLDFTGAEDFPYGTLNVDRVHKRNALAHMYISINRAISHAAIIHSRTKQYWFVEKSTDKKRGYNPYDIYRCPKHHIRFIELLKPGKPKMLVNPFFGHCHCSHPGLYVVSAEATKWTWFCESHRPIYGTIRSDETTRKSLAHECHCPS